MRFLYSLIIHFLAFLIKIASLFSKKAKLRSASRKYIFPLLEKKCAVAEKIVWFHCASLGEFEQGKPLMEKIKKEDKNVTLLVTFFSPSGYEIKKNDPIAEIITYLPMDTPKNAKKFIQIAKPQKTFFVKYEFWYNYIHVLSQKNIPFYYVSANFRESQYFFKMYGKWFLKQLKTCSGFFVQNESSEKILLKYGIPKVTVTGDTRFDRVYKIAKQQYELDFITSFKDKKKLLVAGSTWKQDEKMLSELFQRIASGYKLVVAPHLVENKHIIQTRKRLHSFATICLSEIENQDLATYDVLIVDSIGLLSKIYKYADISYIGGAFKTGLHNILEAVVFEKPVFFGPNFQKFNEAVSLVEKGAAFSVKKAEDMLQKINNFGDNPASYIATCEICKNYLLQNLGATNKILNSI